jgi:heat shock protein HslJ
MQRPASTEDHCGVTIPRKVHVKHLGVGLMAVALLMIAASCGDDDTASSSETLTADSLDGKTFLSTDVTGQTLVADTRITMRFEGESLSAVAGCNTMTGGYTIEGDVLKVGALAQTRMACDEDLTAQDAWIVELLTGNPKATFADDVLTLATDATTVKFGDREKVANSSALDGSAWTMKTLETGGTTAQAPENAYLSYDDGRIFVSTGCNHGTAELTLGDGTVTVGPMAMTLKACSEELTTWEGALVGFLQGELKYDLSGSNLTLSNDSGKLTLELI